MSCILNNFKFWDIAIEDPSFEYNDGVGRELALHPVYGAESGYKPKLISPGGVGYFKASGAGSLVRGKL